MEFLFIYFLKIPNNLDGTVLFMPIVKNETINNIYFVKNESFLRTERLKRRRYNGRRKKLLTTGIARHGIPFFLVVMHVQLAWIENFFCTKELSIYG